MQLSDTVDLAATDDSEIAHADLLGEALFDERHAREPVAVAGELLFDRLEEDPSERVSKMPSWGLVVYRLQVLWASSGYYLTQMYEGVRTIS